MICTRQLDSIPLWNASTNICLWNQSYEIGRCQVFSCQNGTSTKCLEERFKEFSAKKAPRVKKPWNQFKRENVINQDYLCVWTDLQILILGCSPNPREISCRHFVLSVCVENLCISEASIHFPRQLLERSMRKRVTYRASPEYGLISIFHSVKNAYFITPHSQPKSRNAKCSLFVPRPLRRVGLFLRE